MRTKTLEYDGTKLTIAPLSLAQVQKFEAEAIDLDKLSDTEKAAAARKRACEIVAYSLNNANPGAAETDRWTPERCRDEMDQWLLFELQKRILNFAITAGV
jgi:hypothetical protein